MDCIAIFHSRISLLRHLGIIFKIVFITFLWITFLKTDALLWNDFSLCTLLTVDCFQNAVANPQPSLGIVRAEEPKSLNYSGETSRLLSFRRWPQNAKQTADDLARAGFYYTGRVASVSFSTHQFSLLSPSFLFCLISIFFLSIQHFSPLSVLPSISLFSVLSIVHTHLLVIIHT